MLMIIITIIIWLLLKRTYLNSLIKWFLGKLMLAKIISLSVADFTAETWPFEVVVVEVVVLEEACG